MGVRHFAVLAAACVLFVQCAFEEPQAPSWEVPLKYPLLSKNLTMPDLVSENVVVFNYENGLLGLRVEGDLEDVQVGDHLLIQDSDRQMVMAMPNMNLARITADDVNFPFTRLTAQAANPAPAGQIIDPFSFTDVKGVLMPEQDIETIQVIEGEAQLIYTNNLPVDLNNVVFYLIEPTNREIVLTAPPIPLIPAGKKDSLKVSIVGKSFNRTGEWYMAGSSPGSNGRVMAVSSGAAVELVVAFIDFRIHAIRCRNQTFYIEHQQVVDLESDPAIQEGVFRNGVLELSIANKIDLDLDLKITVAEILDPTTGKPLIIETQVAANNPRRVSKSLSQHKLYLGSKPIKPVELHFAVEAVGAGQRDELVTISDEDILDLKVSIRNAVFATMSGAFDRYRVEIDSTTQMVSMPTEIKNFSGINLSDGRMQLDFYNTMETLIALDGSLRGVSEAGRAVRVPIRINIAEGSANQPRLTSLLLGMPTYPEVVDLMNLPPKLISFSGSAFIGDGKPGLLSSSSYLKTHYMLETPAILSWQESVLAEDSIRLVIEPLNAPKKAEEDGIIRLRAEDTNQLRSFAIVSEIENHLPVSAKIEFQLIDQSADTFPHVFAVQSIDLPAAPMDDYGRITAAHKNASKIAFDGDCLAKFHNSGKSPRSLAITTMMLIHGTQEKGVKVFNGDYLSINAAVELVVDVGQK